MSECSKVIVMQTGFSKKVFFLMQSAQNWQFMRAIVSTLFVVFLMIFNNGCTALKNPNDLESGEIKQNAKCTPKNPCRKADCVCENPPPKLITSAPVKRETVCQTVDEQLLQAASSIEKSLFVLAAAEKVENPPILNTAPLITPEGGMGGFIDVDWTGPLGPLVDKIAKLSGYRVKTLGNEPPIPVVVSISAKQAILAEVLQNASFQAGRKATILVFPSNRVIEVRYSI